MEVYLLWIWVGGAIVSWFAFFLSSRTSGVVPALMRASLAVFWPAVLVYCAMFRIGENLDAVQLRHEQRRGMLGWGREMEGVVVKYPLHVENTDPPEPHFFRIVDEQGQCLATGSSPTLIGEIVRIMNAAANERIDESMAEGAIAIEKLRAWTDPDAPLSSPVGTCVGCGEPERYTYHVPENWWRRIVPEKWWNEIVCAGCFHQLSQKKE